jgi:hypothetical protein
MIKNQAGAPAYGGFVVELKIAAQLSGTGYYPNAVRIDGSAQTLLAQGTTSTINKFNVWTFQLWRVGSSWTKVVLKTVEAF